jgi:hypothetical protein
MGRIEHKLLDGDKPPNRPKTNGRNTIIPQESNERNIFPQRKRAGVPETRPVMVGAERMKTVTRDGFPSHAMQGASYTPATFGADRTLCARPPVLMAYGGRGHNPRLLPDNTWRWAFTRRRPTPIGPGPNGRPAEAGFRAAPYRTSMPNPRATSEVNRKR